jgi:hypothetical protein
MRTMVHHVLGCTAVLSLALGAGCSSRVMPSALTIGPHGCTTMHVLGERDGQLHLANRGNHSLDLRITTDGALPAIDATLAPDGRCAIGLDEVQRIEVLNESAGTATLLYIAEGPGVIQVTNPVSPFGPVANAR